MPDKAFSRPSRETVCHSRARLRSGPFLATAAPPEPCRNKWAANSYLAWSRMFGRPFGQVRTMSR
eukprot:5942889-Lingulodinium_polyedra.AAC.1